MKLAWPFMISVICVHVLVSGSPFAGVCDVQEGMGFFHWPEKVTGRGTLEISPDGPVVAGTSAT